MLNDANYNSETLIQILKTFNRVRFWKWLGSIWAWNTKARSPSWLWTCSFFGIFLDQSACHQISSDFLRSAFLSTNAAKNRNSLRNFAPHHGAFPSDLSRTVISEPHRRWPEEGNLLRWAVAPRQTRPSGAEREDDSETWRSCPFSVKILVLFGQLNQSLLVFFSLYLIIYLTDSMI